MTWSQWLLVAAGITVAVYVLFVLWLLLTGRRQDARALAGFIPDCVVLVRRLLADHRVPRRSKLLLVALIAYLAMPIDIVPDSVAIGVNPASRLTAIVVVITGLTCDLGGRRKWRWRDRAEAVVFEVRAGCAVGYAPRVSATVST